MFFADVRGSTAIAEKVGPVEFAALLNRFYKVAMDALIPKNAIIDKMIGDEVMAFFVPAWQEDSQRAAMEAATGILKAGAMAREASRGYLWESGLISEKPMSARLVLGT